MKRQSGAALIVVMAIMVALLGASLYLTSGTSANTNVARYSSLTRASLYCAEAGIYDAKQTLILNSAIWNSLLDGDPTNDPDWYPFTGDLDMDGVSDYIVTVRDNDDELPVDGDTSSNDRTVDSDSKIYAISRCTKYSAAPREAIELISVGDTFKPYKNQSGQGQGNTGNVNE